MQPGLFSYRKRLFFSDFPGNIWVASFMPYAFQGSTILQSGVFKPHIVHRTQSPMGTLHIEVQ